MISDIVLNSLPPCGRVYSIQAIFSPQINARLIVSAEIGWISDVPGLDDVVNFFLFLMELWNKVLMFTIPYTLLRLKLPEGKLLLYF